MKNRTTAHFSRTVPIFLISAALCLPAAGPHSSQHRAHTAAISTLLLLEYLAPSAYAVPDNIRGNGEALFRYFKHYTGRFEQKMDEWNGLTDEERDAVKELERQEDEARNRNLQRGPVDLPVGVSPVSSRDWERVAAAAFHAVMDKDVSYGVGVDAAIERNMAALGTFYEQQHAEGIAHDTQLVTAQRGHELAIREQRKNEAKRAAASAKFKADLFATQQGLNVVDDLPMPHAATAGTETTLAQNFFHRDLALLKFMRLGQLLQSLAMINILTVGDGSVPQGSFLGMGMGPGVRNLSDLEWRIAKLKDLIRLAEGGMKLNKSEEELRTELMQLEAQRDALLSTSGMPDSPKLREQRISYLNTLTPAAQNIKQKYDAWQQARDHYLDRSQLQRAQSQNRGYSIPQQYIVTDTEVANAKAAMDRAKQDYLTALNGNGIMMVNIKHGDFEGPFWRWLAGFDGEQSVALEVMNQALLGLADLVRADIVRIGDMRYRSELLVEFGSPVYAPLRALVVQQMRAVFPNIGPGMEFIASAYLGADLEGKLSNQELDAKLVAGQLALAFFTVIFPPLWVITAPLSVTLSMWQLGYDIDRANQASTRLEGAESAIAAGGSVDNRAIQTLQQAVTQQNFAVFMSAVGVGVDGMFFLKATGEALAAGTKLETQLSEAAARTATGAGDSLTDLIPAGARPASMTATSNADEIIDGIDLALMSEFKTVQSLDGVQQFVRANGLGPQQTARIGGQTFHFSAPFMADGKLAVLVYQEAGGGGYLLRTFYRSESHGIFRAATGRVNMKIGKGHFTYLDNAYNPVSGATVWSPDGLWTKGGEFANPFQEFTADIAAELQGPLARWTGSQPLLNLNEAAANRAFWGHLEDISPGDANVYTKIDAGGTAGEFGLHAGRSTQMGDLTPGMRADLSNPLDQWVIEEGLYKGANAAQFRSADGNYIYTVIKDKDGVFVSSIQDATSGIGPFGTRWEAVDPGNFANPLFDYDTNINRLGGRLGPTRGNYYQNLDNATPLSNWFNENWGNIGQPGARTTPWPGGEPVLAQTLFDPAQTVFMNPNTVLPVPRSGVAPLAGATQANPLILRTTRDALQQNWGLNLLPGPAIHTMGQVIPQCNSEDRAVPNTGLGPIGYRCPYGADEFNLAVNMPNFSITGMQDWLAQNNFNHVESNGLRAQQMNDPLYGSRGSWGQDYDDQWGTKQVRLDFGDAISQKATSKGERATVVAVIDTGVAWSHEDLDPDSIWINPNEVPGNDFDDDHNGYIDDIVGWNFINDDNLPWDVTGHGTMVAGIIAAKQNNGIGIAGINPNVKLMVLKALDQFGYTRASYLAQAIYYAANNGADIINLSVGGSGLTQLEQAAVDYANSRGLLIITAAGNDHIDTRDYAPAGLQGVITVTATDQKDKVLGFSNHGQQVDVAAPGIDIVGLRAPGTDVVGIGDKKYKPGKNFVGKNAGYYRASGTSFSAPIVSGTASLLLDARPDLDRIQVAHMLTQSAKDIEEPGFDLLSGYGRLDAAAALNSDPEYYVDARIENIRVINKDGRPHVRVTGTADANAFDRSWIEIGAGDDPSEWKKVSRNITDPVHNDVLDDIPAGEFAGSKKWLLRLITRHKNGQQRENRFILNVG